LIAARPTWPNNGQIEKQQNSKTAKQQDISQAQEPKSGANISHFNHALWGNLRAATQRVGRKGSRRPGQKAATATATASKMQHQQCNINCSLLKFFQPQLQSGAMGRKANGLTVRIVRIKWPHRDGQNPLHFPAGTRLLPAGKA